MQMTFTTIHAAEPTIPHEEIAAALAAGKCGDCYACCAGYHEQCQGKDYDWGADLHSELCSVHHVVLGEGAPCAVCEALGQRELDIVKRLHHATNAHYVQYHVERDSMRIANHGQHKLRMIVDHDWSAGIPREQCEIDCMLAGFSLCVVVPYITARWGLNDRAYAEYAEQCRLEAEADGYVLIDPWLL